MKQLVRAILFAFLIWLSAFCVFADEAESEADLSFNEPEEYRQEQERYWAMREPDAELSIHYTMIDCGEKKLDFTQQGVLDVTYRFAHTFWAGYAEYGHGYRLDSGLDYMGDNATLRVRIFGFRNHAGEEILCTITNFQTADGTDWGGSLGFTPLANTEDPSARSTSYSFESYAPPEETGQTPAEPDDAAAPSPPGGGDPALPDAPDRNETRSFAWLSSDERVLWSVELCGAFHGSECVEASGSVEVCDENWRCEDAAFFVRDGCAVAMVTLRRYTLGVPVAERSFEFRLPPPARAYPSG